MNSSDENNFLHSMKNACYFVGDETKSTVSDTWSTDVLASDSEPPEINQYDRLEEVVRQSLLARQEVNIDKSRCKVMQPV